jgi:plastocyanin
LSEGDPFVFLAEDSEGEEQEEAEDEAEDEAEAGETVQVRLTEFEIEMPAEIPAGETTFEIENVGSVGHSFTISGGDVEAALDAPLGPGQTATLTVDLPAGEYEIVCPVANHAELGMTAQLVVVGGDEGEAEEADEEAEEEDVEEEDVEDEETEPAAELGISIVDFAFDPATAEVTVGTIVTWTNDDAAPHTVTSDDGAFDSGRLEPGESFSFTFEEAGSFPYHCDIHLSMTASIEVAEGEAETEAEDEDAGADEETDEEATDEEATAEEEDAGDEEAEAPQELAISIADFAFDPATAEVAVGTTITWTNDDAAPHTVTSDDGAFDSGTLDPGGSFSFTFEEAGSFAYHCDIHPSMTASVEVAEAEAEESEEAEEAEDEAEEAPEEITISIADFAFDPATAEVAPGTIVTWVNDDAAPHTVTSDDGAFDSGRLEPGDSFEFTFDEPGSFPYHCDIHPNMTASVEVAEDEEEEAAAGEPAVEIVNFAFAPETLEVEAGTTVTWTNNDAAPHTVTSDDGAFDSGTIDPGGSFEFTFDEAGSFAYHCDIHPRMTATIEVT